MLVPLEIIGLVVGTKNPYLLKKQGLIATDKTPHHVHFKSVLAVSLFEFNRWCDERKRPFDTYLERLSEILNIPVERLEAESRVPYTPNLPRFMPRPINATYSRPAATTAKPEDDDDDDPDGEYFKDLGNGGCRYPVSNSSTTSTPTDRLKDAVLQAVKEFEKETGVSVREIRADGDRLDITLTA